MPMTSPPRMILAPLSCLGLAVALFGAGCMDGGSAFAPTQSQKTAISETSIQDYLAEAQLGRPETVREVTVCLQQGRTFRKRILDQKNRWTLATVWIDRSPQSTLHVQTSRDETCPACKGLGKRQWDAEAMKNMPFDTRCLKCDGKGSLPHYTEERKYVISAGDYASPGAAAGAEAVRAPPEAQRQIDRLPSQKPAERLEALLWLDGRYVRLGDSFQNIMPMLKKARWYEADPKKKIMVWQFWAGKGAAGEEARTYYRVYADRKNGKITKKGFFPEQ